MVDVAFIILFALIGNYLFNKIGLPGILGMIAAGVVLGPSGIDLIDPAVQSLLAEFKTIALIVILIRAGLGISKEILNRVGGPAIRMGFIPGIIEGVTIAAGSHVFLDFSYYEAGMLGFIIAAVSPAVVVPSMLELKKRGFGKKKGVPTLVLAGASLENVIAITIFGIFAGLATGSSTNWTYILIGVPAGIILGIIIGIGIGIFLVWFFKKYHLRDTMKVILFMLISVILYDMAEAPYIKEIIPIAALLSIMAIGFVILLKYDILANRMAMKFDKIWVLAEILLFVYIGTEVKLSEIDISLIGIGLIILTIGLIFRSFGVWLSLLKSGLNKKENYFCMIAYIPKATVQAAIGAVPLSIVLSGQAISMTPDTGQTILTIAVLSIIFTAPLGAIGIKWAGPKFLRKES